MIPKISTCHVLAESVLYHPGQEHGDHNKPIARLIVFERAVLKHGSKAQYLEPREGSVARSRRSGVVVLPMAFGPEADS